MLEFLKKLRYIKRGSFCYDSGADAIIKENGGKLDPDEVYRISVKRTRMFFQADHAARKQAGLENAEGQYTFTCPNCGSECVGSWIKFRGKLHGSTGCSTCHIFLRV